MRSLPFLISALLAAPLLSSFAATSSPSPSGPIRSRVQDDDDDDEEHEHSPLHEAMNQMQAAQRAMRKLSRDPVGNKEALLRAVGAIEEGALTAYRLPPPAPEGENPEAWRIGFRRQLLQLLDAALAAELAVHEGDAEALAAAYKAISGAKKEGHDRYQEDEDDDD